MELQITKGNLGDITDLLNLLVKEYPTMDTKKDAKGGIIVKWKDKKVIKSEPKIIEKTHDRGEDSSQKVEKENI